MIRQELLATAQVPGQAGELQLFRHDRDYMFRVDRVELMTSRVHGSEELLAELALERVPSSTAQTVLVGGLGMGFTLASVLKLVDSAATVEVVELVPEVVEWNREWLGELTGHPLNDPRVRLSTGDVGERLRSASARFDAILMDVDNGPEGLTRAANDWLYGSQGLAAARKALQPGGVLAIWSSASHPWFTERLERGGFEVAEERVRARRTKGARRTIWFASRPTG